MAAGALKHTTARVAVRDLCFAKLLTDDGTSAPTYDTVHKTQGLMKIGINPNASQDSMFYDDGPNEATSTLGKIEVEIEKSSLSPTEIAFLLGAHLDSNGCLVEGAEDTPPYVAVGFKSKHSSGKYEYVWLYKVKFMSPETNYETQGETPAYQSNTISGLAVKLNYEYTVATDKIHPWRIKVEEEDQGDVTGKAEVLAKWFDAVVLPNATFAA